VARRVFLHVGTSKSGTSYLQSLWWRHRDQLAERGLLLPGSRLRDHFHAASLVCERTEVVDRLGPRERQVWERLLTDTADWAGDALISHELFSPASPAQADRALRALERAAEQVHVVVTARDLARQLRSDWQQNVKQGLTDSLEEFWSRVRDHPDDPWWSYQDLASILDRWTQGLPAGRTHLIVLPPPGREPPEWLWQRACELFEVDPRGLDTEVTDSNPALGLVEVEVLRRVQAAMPAEERTLDMRRLTRDFLAEQVLSRSGPGTAFALTPEMQDWALDRSATMAATIVGRGYDVVGDLQDLRPPVPPPSGRTPDSVMASELGEVAIASLTRMLVLERQRRERGRSRAAGGTSAQGTAQGPRTRHSPLRARVLSLLRTRSATAPASSRPED